MRIKLRFDLKTLLTLTALIAVVMGVAASVYRAITVKQHLEGCSYNLKLLALAIHNYADIHGNLPPPYTTDAAGERLHSWRSLMLPMFCELNLFRQIRQNEPWNSSYNQQVTSTPWPLGYFHCPSDIKKHSNNTSYVAILGAGTVWDAVKPVKFTDISDAQSDTILLIEMRNSGIACGEPRDLELNRLPPGITKANLLRRLSNHAGGFNAVFVDGHVEFIPETIPWSQFEAILTKSGGETVARNTW